MTEFVNIISNFGFPVAISCYLLFRFEKKLDNLENTNDKMIEEIKRMEDMIANFSGRRK